MSKLTEEQKKHRKVRKQWLKALRSGNYKQGYGYLHYKGKGEQNRFCCLGVLCDLAEKAGIVSKSAHDNPYSYNGDNKSLPNVVKNWVGLRTATGDFIGKKSSSRNLASINDRRHDRFDEIANIIESNPEGLFVD